ncbi:MAG: MFS transporter [Chloroflexi bacterium]|nr:MFS transporter [Chloroflexota bacterium]
MIAIPRTGQPPKSQVNTQARRIAARIDRLPMSREIWLSMFLAGIAWLVESYDIGVISSALPSLQKQFGLDAFGVGTLAIASTLGIVISVIPAGSLADRVGRKTMLVIGTIWYATFSLLCAFAPNPTIVVLLRFVAGFGMGAIFPIPYAMAAELMPHNFRGAMTGILDSFLSVGYFLAPLLAFVLVPSLPLNLGWRVLFLIGGIPLLYVPIVLKWMPESPRWLAVNGRLREADSVVSGIEQAIERRAGAHLPEPVEAMPDGGGSTDGETNEKHSGWRDRYAQIVHGSFLTRSAMMWIAFSCILFIFYAIQTYTPTVLIQKGYGSATAFLMTAIIVTASIPGKYLAGFMSERFGRKPTLFVFTAAAAAAAVVFGLLNDPLLSLLCGVVLAFFGIGVDPVVKIYGAEQYPTRIRETGVGLFEGVGRFFGGVMAPFIMAFILASSHVWGAYVFVAVVAFVGIGAVALWGAETRGRTNE